MLILYITLFTAMQGIESKIQYRYKSNHGDNSIYGNKDSVQNNDPENSCKDFFASRAVDKCQGEVQLAIVMDITWTHQTYLYAVRNITGPLFKDIKNKWPGSVFGLTSFSDWPYIIPESTGYCYRFDQEFTDDSTVMSNSIKALKFQNGGKDNEETSLTALLYTAKESKLKWKENTDYRKVFKILLIGTDREWKSKDDDSIGYDGPDPKGDGTDTCANGKPDVELVKSVLEREDFYVVGLVSGHLGFEIWTNYSIKYNLDPKHFLIRKLAEHSETEILKAICKVVGEIMCHTPCDNPWVYDFNYH